ncbi:DUF1330 domain-containing protein [Actinomadura sp. NPDC048021]|uniref:DUF1330 domain-containing protein n=1 Tax=Actinomadura sp. NPDC048021 TaxID=3155385 RepID=UPI0033F35F81
MNAYVIAHLRDAAPHPEIAEYIERLPGTFGPYGGRYLVHFKQHEVKEGAWLRATTSTDATGAASSAAASNSPRPSRSTAPQPSSTPDVGRSPPV